MMSLGSAAFNTMTHKLDEYEHSNLPSILFEKKRIETIINSMRDAIIGFSTKSRSLFLPTRWFITLSACPNKALRGNMRRILPWKTTCW